MFQGLKGDSILQQLVNQKVLEDFIQVVNSSNYNTTIPTSPKGIAPVPIAPPREDLRVLTRLEADAPHFMPALSGFTSSARPILYTKK